MPPTSAKGAEGVAAHHDTHHNPQNQLGKSQSSNQGHQTSPDDAQRNEISRQRLILILGILWIGCLWRWVCKSTRSLSLTADQTRRNNDWHNCRSNSDVSQLFFKFLMVDDRLFSGQHQFPSLQCSSHTHIWTSKRSNALP